MRLLLIICIMLMPIPNAIATPIIADLGVRSVDIDHNFDGLDLLMFGAQNDAGRIIIALRGPKKTYVVRKKERVAGVWANHKSVTFENTNNYYALAASHPLKEIRNNNLLKNFELDLSNITIAPSSSNGRGIDQTTVQEFRQALVSEKLSDELYSGGIGKISFWGDTLFRTTLNFPKNIERGWYTAEVYLFSNGILSAIQTTPIHVSKIGMAAYIFDSAHNNSFIYGIVCVIMALLAGWSANAVFKRT